MKQKIKKIIIKKNGELIISKYCKKSSFREMLRLYREKLFLLYLGLNHATIPLPWHLAILAEEEVLCLPRTLPPPD